VLGWDELSSKILVFVLFWVILFSFFSVFSINKISEADTTIFYDRDYDINDGLMKEFFFVESSNLDDIAALESLGCRVVEVYDFKVLVECDISLVSYLEDSGFSVRSLPYRSTLFVGDVVFDCFVDELVIPNGLFVDRYDGDQMELYLVHMVGPIAKEWRPALEELGVEVLHYIHNYAYLVRMKPEQKSSVLGLYFVDWVGVYHPFFKFKQDIVPGLMYIGLVADASIENIEYMRENVIVRSETINDEEYLFIAEIQSEQTIHEIAKINDVLYILSYIKPQLHDEMATQVIGGGLWFFDDEDNKPETVYRLHGAFGSLRWLIQVLEMERLVMPDILILLEELLVDIHMKEVGKMAMVMEPIVLVQLQEIPILAQELLCIILIMQGRVLHRNLNFLR